MLRSPTVLLLCSAEAEADSVRDLLSQAAQEYRKVTRSRT
jgi:hypothetical protein